MLNYQKLHYSALRTWLFYPRSNKHPLALVVNTILPIHADHEQFTV